MRRLYKTRLPETKFLTDPATQAYAKQLNIEVDGLRRDLNRYFDKIVITSQTSAYTVAANDDFIACNGTFTVTLPPVDQISGKTYVIKNTGTGTITIDANASETIDGNTTVSLASQYDFIKIVSDSTEWHIISRYIQ